MAFLLVALAGPGRAVEGDIVFKRTGDTDKDTPAAVFPHWAHRIRFRCYVCHDAIFQMKAGSSPVTMDAIMDGKFCGA
jgi:c(7)-type cytochrome triheme protein